MTYIRRRLLAAKYHVMTVMFHNMSNATCRVCIWLRYPNWLVRTHLWLHDRFRVYCAAWMLNK